MQRIQRLTASAFVLATTTTVTMAGGPPISAWDQTWVPDSSAWALADLVEVGPAGELYVSTRPQVGGNNGTGLVKYNADGSLAWAIIREEVPNGSEGLTDLEITDEGISAVGVSRDRSGNPQTLLVNYDAGGTLLWEARTGGPVIAGMFAPQLAITSSGDRVIATDDGNGVGSIERFDAGGTLVSAVPLSFTGFGGVTALDVDGDGNAILVSLDDSSTYIVAKYDPAGVLLWSHEESGDGLALSEAFMVVSPRGDVVVTGALEIVDGGSGFVVARVWRLSPTGQLIWTLDTEADFEIGRDLAMGDEEEVYLLSTNQGSTVTRISATGAIDWSRSYVGDDFQTSLRQVEVSAFGDVIVGGVDFALPGTFFGSRVLCYSAAGDLEWTGRITDGVVFGGDLQTGADGSVGFVATTRDANDNDLALTMRFEFSACLGDLDNDGSVGFSDLLQLLSTWGESTNIGGDLDQSGEIGFSDLLVLLSAWGPCV